MHIYFLKDYIENGELLYRKGDDKHVHASVAENLFFKKVAERYKYASRVEYLNAYEKSRVPVAGDTVVNFVHPPRWELGIIPVTNKVALYYLAGTEKSCFRSLTWFDDDGNERPIPALQSCPKELLERFKNALADEALAATGAFESARAEQQVKQDHDSKHGVTRFFNRLGISTQ